MEYIRCRQGFARGLFLWTLVLALPTAAETFTPRTFPDSPKTVLVAASNASAADKAVATYVCTGTNDEAVINRAIADLDRGGKVRLSNGDFYIDSFTNEGHSAVFFGYNGGNARVVGIEGGTENKSYNTRFGTGIHVTERALRSMETGTVYRAFYGTGRRPKSRGLFFSMTYVNNVTFRNFYLLFHDASKSWHGIDGRQFGNMKLTQVGIYTERYFEDRFMHIRPAPPSPGSVGVVSVPGANDEMSSIGYDTVCVGGMHTGFVIQGVDHLIMQDCAASRCCYGYHFKGTLGKTLTILNSCDEGNAHLPLFEATGHLTMLDFNIERYNADYIPVCTDPADASRGAGALETKPGGWHGYISYLLRGSAFGLRRFWQEGSGFNFKTVNLEHSRRSRPACPEPGETVFDSKTRKTLTWDDATRTWVDAMGVPVK